LWRTPRAAVLEPHFYERDPSRSTGFGLSHSMINYVAGKRNRRFRPWLKRNGFGNPFFKQFGFAVFTCNATELKFDYLAR
jgi:hypothetical protein